jgi:hypothetical protein
MITRQKTKSPSSGEEIKFFSHSRSTFSTKSSKQKASFVRTWYTPGEGGGGRCYAIFISFCVQNQQQEKRWKSSGQVFLSNFYEICAAQFFLCARFPSPSSAECRLFFSAMMIKRERAIHRLSVCVLSRVLFERKAKRSSFKI